MPIVDELARWLEAETRADIAVTTPFGKDLLVPRLLRREVRSPETIDRTSSCWAPNKPALTFDGEVTWAEFILVRLLQRQGWGARWMKNWVGGREPCVSVGRSEPLPPAAGDMLRRIDVRAAIATGGGAWDIFAWRDDEYLCIESKQHGSSDKLRPTQITWLDAAIDVGVSSYVVVEYDAPRLARSAKPRASAASGPSEAKSSAEVAPDLAAILAEASTAEPADRINYRDPIAAFGASAIDPLLEWVSHREHSAFAVKVIEKIGVAEPDAARDALSRAAVLDPSIAGMAADASRALSPNVPSPSRRAGSGRSGVLGPTYAAAAPRGQGCEWLTKQGRPCQNPANYWVDGKWSCSRDHRS